MNPMRILVQNCLTHQFLAGDDQWTEDHWKAQTFNNTNDALDACLRRRNAELQIVLKFDLPTLDVSLPLNPSVCSGH